MGWREPVCHYKRRADIVLPVVVPRDESARRVKQAENRIGEYRGKLEAAERWPQRAKHYRFGIGPRDDKAADQNVVTARNDPSGRDVERLRSHSRKPAVFQMNWSSSIGSVTKKGCVLIVKNPITRRV